MNEVRRALAALVARTEGEIRGIADYDNISTHFPEYGIAGTFMPRVERKLKSRLLYSCLAGPILYATDALYNRESRFLPGITCDLTLTDDEVLAIYYSGGISSQLITDPHAVRALNSLFETLWTKCNPLPTVLEEGDNLGSSHRLLPGSGGESHV